MYVSFVFFSFYFWKWIVSMIVSVVGIYGSFYAGTAKIIKSVFHLFIQLYIFFGHTIRLLFPSFSFPLLLSILLHFFYCNTNKQYNFIGLLLLLCEKRLVFFSKKSNICSHVHFHGIIHPYILLFVVNLFENLTQIICTCAIYF